MKNILVIGDADALIGLVNPIDIHHKKSITISKIVGIEILFPDTAIAEGITTVQRKLSQPHLAKQMQDEVENGTFSIVYVDSIVMHTASQLFNPHGSKQNTFFDAIVAATAKKLGADAIFSFDAWYKKLGFTLAGEL